MLRNPLLRIVLVVALALFIGGARGSSVAHADPQGSVYRACGWEVTIGGEGSPPCMSLPDAIAAAAADPGSDTIEMYPGSYCPIDLTGSDGPITFTGIGAAGLSAGDGVPSEETDYESQLTSFAYSSLYCGSPPPTGDMVYVHNDIGPTQFENLSIEGGDPSNPDHYAVSNGLQVESADVQIRDVLVENFPGKGIIYGDSCYNGCYGEGFEMVSSASIDNGQAGFLGDDAEIANSTLAGNGTFGVSLAGFFELYNDTITGNEYGFDAYLGSYESQIEVWDTVVAGNTVADCSDYSDESGYYGWETAYSGYNLVGVNAQNNPSCPDNSGTDGTFDNPNTIPIPGANGGPTPSVRLPGDQWAGAGQNCIENTDQLEFVRGSECDIGSFSEGTTSDPNLTASSGELGQIDSGQTSGIRVTFANTGGDLVGVYGPSISGNGYSIADENCTYSLLEPAYASYTDLSCSVDVSVTPNADGTWDGTLKLSTTAGDVSVPLHAQAVTRPVGVDDSYDVDGASLTDGATFDVAAPGVLANDPSGTTVDEVVGQPSDGVLTGPNADGSFSYLPDTGFTGDDSFQYTIVGGDGIESHPITVTLDVLTPRPGPPVFVNASWADLADGSTVTASDGLTHTIGTDAFATVDDGLNAAQDASTVNVAPGTYDEGGGDLYLEEAGVQLVGAGTSTHIVDLDQLDVEASDVTIQGLNLSGTGTWDPSTLTYTGSNDPLVYVDGEYGATNVTVKGCKLQNAAEGVYLVGAAESDSSTPDDDVFQSNQITHVVKGIELDGAVDSSIVGNNIHDTGATTTHGGGGAAQAAILLDPYSDGNTISSNTIASSGNIGISIRSSLNVVRANTISNSGTTYPAFKESSGIEVVGNGDENPSANEIINNTITGSAFVGIKLGYGVEFTTITGNTISGTLHGGANGGLPQDAAAGGSGILITGYGAVGTDMFHNTLLDNAGWGIFQEDSEGDSWGTWADHNDFLGNLLGGVENDDLTDGFNATNNWWGDPSGPSVDGPGSGQAVLGATFNPWLGCTQGATSCPVLNTAPPTVNSTTPMVGQLLTGTLGSWSGTAPITTVAVHWLQCDASGNNCTTLSTGRLTYRVQTTDIGHTIEYEVEKSNPGADVTAASAPTQQVTGAAPANDPTAPPSTGSSTAYVGQVLTATAGTWSGTAPITTTVHWLQCDASGQNCGPPLSTGRMSYRVQSTDLGHTLEFEVEKSNAWGDVTVVSAPTQQVTGPPPVNKTPPTVSSSTAVVGQVLGGSPGSWTGAAPITTTLRWLQCDLSGNNCSVLSTGHAYYRVQPTDVGHAIEFEVEKSNIAGDVIVASAPTPVS